jgi:hypothetical protein
MHNEPQGVNTVTKIEASEVSSKPKKRPEAGPHGPKLCHVIAGQHGLVMHCRSRGDWKSCGTLGQSVVSPKDGGYWTRAFRITIGIQRAAVSGS